MVEIITSQYLINYRIIRYLICEAGNDAITQSEWKRWNSEV